METLFENRYVRTKEHIKEMYRYILFVGSGAIMSHILTLILIAINVALIVTDKSMSSFSYIVLFAIVSFPLMRVINYFRAVNFTVNKDLELNNGGQAYISLDVREDIFTFSSTSGSRSDVSYMELRAVKQTKNLILLSTDTNICYVFPKDAFTKGSATGFKEFLKSKGFDIK
jgi:hypothetical protein